MRSVVVHSGAFTQSQHCGVFEVDVDALGFDESAVSELRKAKTSLMEKKLVHHRSTSLS